MSPSKDLRTSTPYRFLSRSDRIYPVRIDKRKNFHVKNCISADINSNISIINCYTEEIDGIIVIINEPHVWPNSGTMISSGSMVSMSLECVSGYATQRVLELDKDKRPCLYNETDGYNQETCLSLCKRHWVVKYCGCNPSFLFPTSMVFYICETTYDNFTKRFIYALFMSYY